jgi:Pyridoxamine 5'-phosphate oxidase
VTISSCSTISLPVMGTTDRPTMTPGRPDMPGGYGIASGADGLLPWSWVEDSLVAARSYWVCTTRADGRPHAMPVWGLWLDGRLWFSTDPESVKGRNLAARRDVVVHLESGDDVVVVTGEAERQAADDLPPRFVDSYAAKYSERIDLANPAFGFYRVRADRVLAWREQDFPTSATRFGFAR